MILFAKTITPRLQYVADFIGKEITGDVFQLTSDINTFTNYAGPKINYSIEHITSNEFWVKPHGLLFENDIQPQTVECFINNGNKYFFKTTGDFPFDIFATSFYLLSRYEEYLPHEKDVYGRYAHENSLAFKEKFLHLPLINIWLKDFKNVLIQKFPGLTTHDSRFTFLPTYDIDEAFSYKHKSFGRTLGGITKAVFSGQWSKINERRKVMAGKVKDPYDSFEWMDDLHQRYALKPKYFFLIPNRRGKYDKNNLPREKGMQQLIKALAGKYSIGIHPSWRSGDHPSLVQKEIKMLENISGQKIISSRQHYLRFTLPETFRYLIDIGIREDHSMGYASVNGFRASVASVFYWYDLGKEIQTNLLLYPFCLMDANSFYEQKLTAQQALEEMREYYKILKFIDGLMITLWHNNFFGTDKLFTGWKEAYEQFIHEIS